MTTQQVDVPEYARFDLVDRLHKSLRYARVKPGAMAEYLGVHRNTVGSYLRGSVRPDTRTLKLWALRCGVPFGWLRDGVEKSPDGPGGGSGQPVPQSRCTALPPRHERRAALVLVASQPRRAA